MKRDKNLVIRGVLDGRQAYIGPEVLHVDLTNMCNNDCIGCWCRSPLLGDKGMPDWEKKLTLPFDLIKGVIDDIDEMGGLKYVKLVGGGEPFMHPHLKEIIEYIKNKDKSIEIDINTNFTLVDEEAVKWLVGLGVDSMTVSIWAATPEVYVKTHPNKTEDTFRKITEMLKLLKKLKVNKPWIKMYNVIFNMNYHEVEQMLDFALEVKAEDVQFVPIDPVPGKTNCLLLDLEQRKVLIKKLKVIKQSYNSVTMHYQHPETKKTVSITAFDDFIRRIGDLDISKGTYDDSVVDQIPCYVGWLFTRIMGTGDVVPCCKGHRLPLGNIYRQRFKDIWHSEKYAKFRFNGKNLPKSNLYFSKIGNEASKKTGCYNCDNLWQNEPMHKIISSLPDSTKGLLKQIKNILNH